MQQEIIVLGTGGTIAGTAASSHDHTGYTAAQLGVETLLQSVPGLQDALQGRALRSEQVAQLDSKDMDFATMLRLAQRCVHHLARPEVSGVVITHGTDTLEETAYFLHSVIAPALQAKPIILTCAMRPATSSEADGPRNVADAAWLAGDARSRGVLAVCAGEVHHALAVQKIHTYALNAFSSGEPALGEPGVLARVKEGVVQWGSAAGVYFDQNAPLAHIDSARDAIKNIVTLEPELIRWPRVEIVLNHSHASAELVRALLAHSPAQDPLRGVVVAGTGNGTVSAALEAALSQAREQGVEVVMASRCAWGGIHGGSSLSAVKARVALVLKLLGQA